MAVRPSAFKSANQFFTQTPAGAEYVSYHITANGPGALLVETQVK